jgi:hypothetical protein
MIGDNMLDPSGAGGVDPELARALLNAKQPGESQPMPGLAHGSIPGLLGIAMNGGTGPTAGAPGLSGGLWKPSGGFDQSQQPIPAAQQAAPLPMPQPRPAMAPQPGAPPTAPLPGADAMGMASPQQIAAGPQQGQQSAPPQGGNPMLPQGSLLDRMINGIGNFRDQNRMTLLAMAGGLAGAPSIGTGLGRAFQAAGPAQMQDIQFNRLNQTAQFLQSKGMDPQQAMVIAQNPQMMAQLLPRLMGVKQQKFSQIGEDIDQYGNKVPRYGFIDEVSGSVTPYGAGAPTGVAGGAMGGVKMEDADKHGEDYLGTLDPNRAALLRAIGEGRQPMPSGAQLKQPAGMALRSQVTQAYPDLNEQTFPARQKAFNDFYGGGKDQGVVASVRQSAGHMLALSGSLQDLNNIAGGKVVNAPLNAAEEALGVGSGANMPAVRMNVHAVADELGKIWKGGTNSDAEVKAWEDNFPYNGTPAQQRSAIGKAAELYRGGVDSLERKHRDSFGPAAAGLPPIRDSQAEQTISGIEQWAGGKSTTPPAPGPGTPAPAAPGMQTLPRPQTKQDYDNLASGQPYIAPDGKPYIKGR